MAEKMGDRKRLILRAVTNDYICTAEPVGSRTIARKYNLGVSSATIRNEMADLEDEGYLEQPHTSAGRIPSDKGYRFYVDSLMSDRGLTGVEKTRIRAEYQKRQAEVKFLVKATAKVLGDISQCASIVVGPAVKTAEISHIQLVSLDPQTILVLVVTSTGLIEHRVIQIEHSLSASDLERLSSILNNRLRGSSLGQIKGRVLRDIQAELSAYASVIEHTFELLFAAMHASDEERVHVDGLMQLLGQPEFSEIDRAKPLLQFLESDEAVLNELARAVGAAGGLGGTVVTIGSENEREELKSCSVVSAPYGINGKVIGCIAVVGPTRMDYSLAMTLVGHLAESLSDLLTRASSRRALE